MIAKFSASTNPQPVFFEQFEFTTGVFKYKVNVSGNDYVLSDGDYVYANDDNQPLKYVSSSEYSSSAASKRLIKEQIGSDTRRAIWDALNAASMSDASKATICNAINTVMTLLEDGEIVASQTQASNTATSGAFSPGVKTTLLSLLATSVAKI